jgi:hypothetical protein
MRTIGFSTGALARGDYERGLQLQRRPGVNAVELSALRETELGGLLAAIPHLDLNQFEYVSFHAPSGIIAGAERSVVKQLRAVLEWDMPIIVHPDIISDFGLWRELGNGVLLENMDQRKPVCRTAVEMAPFFEQLPDAGFCFDIGHARQVDPTKTVADELLRAFSGRLTELHISEVNEQCRHVGISASAKRAFRSVASQISGDIPVIIESMIEADAIDGELEMALASLVLDPTTEAVGP